MLHYTTLLHGRRCVQTGGLSVGKFPQKNPGFNFLGLGKTSSLLRTRLLVPVRETFTEGSGTTVFPKLRDTGAG